jgi:DNA adenine methylase
MGAPQAKRQVLSYLKWVGGKTRYASALASLAPPVWDGVYREPFVGSAAVFFEVRPERAHLTDANPDLVVCHQQVAEDPHALMDLLDVMPKTKEFFHKVRAQDPETLTDAERAARLIYLNKQCFRGLWRVNKKGQFNVPWGGYGDSRALYDRDVLLRSSKVLQAATIAEADFTEALDLAGPGDFVFCDPPYVPLGGWSDFKRYTAGQFHEPDHRQLEASMRAAADRGAHVMMTNSNTDLVREIWSNWHIREMATVRDINIDASKRDSSDLVVTSYEVTAPTSS